MHLGVCKFSFVAPTHKFFHKFTGCKLGKPHLLCPKDVFIQSYTDYILLFLLCLAQLSSGAFIAHIYQCTPPRTLEQPYWLFFSTFLANFCFHSSLFFCKLICLYIEYLIFLTEPISSSSSYRSCKSNPNIVI